MWICFLQNLEAKVVIIAALWCNYGESKKRKICSDTEQKLSTRNLAVVYCMLFSAIYCFQNPWIVDAEKSWYLKRSKGNLRRRAKKKVSL